MTQTGTRQETDPTDGPKRRRMQRQTVLPRKHTRTRRKLIPVPSDELLLNAASTYLADLECTMEMFEAVAPELKAKDKLRKQRVDEILAFFEQEQGKSPEAREQGFKLYSEIDDLNNNMKRLNRANTILRQHIVVMMISDSTSSLLPP